MHWLNAETKSVAWIKHRKIKLLPLTYDRPPSSPTPRPFHFWHSYGGTRYRIEQGKNLNFNISLEYSNFHELLENRGQYNVHLDFNSIAPKIVKHQKSGIQVSMNFNDIWFLAGFLFKLFRSNETNQNVQINSL